jgi:hypothetical protein
MFLAAMAGMVVSAGTAEAAEAQDQAKLRYVSAGDSGARARNLYDAQGVVVLEVKKDTILAVHGERAGWLDVEAPGGFKVWVYGEYVRAGSEPGEVRISGSNVRMRPLPSSGPESLPLRQHLSRGDEVRMIKRNDPARSLAEDWVQVWSPPGARAWVRVAETKPLAASAKGASLWATAVAAASSRPVADVGVTPASAPATAKALETADVNALLGKADTLLQNERAKDEAGGVPNYSVVVAAYEVLLTAVDSGPTADLARSRIQLVESYADAYEIRVELEEQRTSLEAAAKERELERDAARTRNALDGRFGARGWLVQRKVTGQRKPVWMLEWSGGAVAEVTCDSGRYDLSVFANYELGVSGRVVRGPSVGSGDIEVRPRQIDISRIEVISGRPAE